MNDLLTQLGQLPTPEVRPELTERVLARAREISAQAGKPRPPQRTDRWLGLVVAAMSVMHLLWTVVFLNGLAR